MCCEEELAKEAYEGEDEPPQAWMNLQYPVPNVKIPSWGYANVVFCTPLREGLVDMYFGAWRAN